MTTAEDRAAVAAELALGVLEGDERADAMRRVLAEPTFAREVEAWRAHFALLFAAWPDAAPSSDVEARLVRLIDRSGEAAANDDAVVRRSPWMWSTGVATLMAACLVLALALRPERTVTVAAPVTVATTAPLVAAITPTKDDADAKPFAAAYDAKTGEIRFAGGVTVPTGRSAELWVIGADAAPHSLGLLAGPASRVSIGGRNLRRITAGATLAVTIEPEGGSPSGLPTGPVVASGTLAKV
ncbi:anti-sigma factor [Sphingomonas oligophenolica]|uniref:Anti-sigma factor n=1 Tax=Sphingomonas oligophenolica TaxID=301154 RepID=A0A502CJA3_9SPHN|nr:anti-sigma factor [Sphingomonas oligophenolica]TPG12724.1 anti-sigma factor [Sphingomonas oligophenolica]